MGFHAALLVGDGEAEIIMTGSLGLGLGPDRRDRLNQSGNFDSRVIHESTVLFGH